jgi:hypothetical protein
MKSIKSASFSSIVSAQGSLSDSKPNTDQHPSPLKPVEDSIYDVICAELATERISKALELSTPEVQEFATTVSKLACDGKFINEFSEHLGTPSEDESEDEFVERAKSTMRYLLRKKLGG